MLKATLTITALILTAAPAIAQDAAAGAELYATNCSSCHGAELEGMADTFPALTGIGERMEPEQIAETIAKGGEMMPPFDYLTEEERGNIVAFLTE